MAAVCRYRAPRTNLAYSQFSSEEIGGGLGAATVAAAADEAQSRRSVPLRTPARNANMSVPSAMSLAVGLPMP